MIFRGRFAVFEKGFASPLHLYLTSSDSRRRQVLPSELTVHLLSSCVREEHAHHLLKVAPGLRLVAVLAHAVQHSLEDVVQGGGRLVQQDGGPRQEAVQVPVCPDLLLKVHQLHILSKRQRTSTQERFIEVHNT